MTVIAFFVQPDLVVAVADTASVTPETGKVTHHPKLCLNILARSVAAGTGWASVLMPAYRAFADAETFDQLPRVITKALRQSVVDRSKTFDDEPDSFAKQTFAIAGWSESAGRMVAYAFPAWTWFVPVLTGSFLSPEPRNWSDGYFPHQSSDLVRIAREQCEELTEAGLGSAEGSLMVAELHPDRIATKTIPNYYPVEAQSCSLMDT